MRKFITEKRLKRIENAVRQRQYTLGVALENIHDSHNVSAIFRSCDAVGVPKVSLIYSTEKYPKISKVTSASALKWVEKERFTSTKECFEQYKKEGFKIFTSLLDEKSISLFDLDLTQKCLIVLGNEHRGISSEAVENSDQTYYIPMRGMVQSLNVSVAAAVTLYEAQRQRLLRGMYEESALPKDLYEELIDEWCEK